MAFASSSRVLRALKSLGRWLAIGVATLLVLELLCHVVQLSNDSSPVEYVPDPHVSYRMKPGSGTSAFGVLWTINEVGLRNPEIRLPKPPGVFRILVLGDSITLGYGVPEEIAYPRVLEKVVGDPRVEVVNAGAAGYHLQDFVGYLEHYGLALQPDLIVCAFTRSDIEPPQKLEIRGGVGYDAGENVGLIPPFLKRALRHSRLYLAVGRTLWALRSQPLERSVQARNDAFLEKWPTVELQLRRLASLAEERHVPLLIPYLPVQVEVMRGVEYPALVERFERLDVKNYKFSNLQPKLAADKYKGVYLPLDPAHPNARGHEIIARAISEDPFFRAALPPGTTLAGH